MILQKAESARISNVAALPGLCQDMPRYAKTCQGVPVTGGLQNAVLYYAAETSRMQRCSAAECVDIAIAGL